MPGVTSPSRGGCRTYSMAAVYIQQHGGDAVGGDTLEPGE
jgi:hypothetical protein